ncbi:MAG: lipase family protein [Pleurocapsa sp. MO_192.B19]|nr:lipase family protein [Pleurocapsa sp. MO_192.B19]
MSLGAGIVARVSDEYSRDRNFNFQRQAIVDAITDEPDHIIDKAYNLEADWDTEVAQRQEILAATKLKYPTIDYDREMSKWMIQSCKLGVQQYKTGRSNPKYDGALTLLPDYNANFHNYRQLASFEIEEEIIENYWQLKESIFAEDNDSNSMQKTLHDAESRIREIVQRIVQRRHRIPVFVGFAIASDVGNIIAFRGTQTQIEWWRNLQATQKDYVDPVTGKQYGRVHQGYLKIVREQISSALVEVVRQLDPTIPCYITGHSLGGAVATLSAIEIALNIPEIREQIQLYTYAALIIGDRAFAEAHSRLIPNSYRIVNLSDSVPLVPPIKIENKFTTANYAHVGQKWSFTAQFGDVLLNHVVDTYRMAIEAQQEMMQEEPFRRMM